MKVLLDIKDHKAKSLLEVLGGLPYVKTRTLTQSQSMALEQMKDAIDELKLVMEGKLEARNAEDLLNEL